MIYRLLIWRKENIKHTLIDSCKKYFLNYSFYFFSKQFSLSGLLASLHYIRIGLIPAWMGDCPKVSVPISVSVPLH